MRKIKYNCKQLLVNFSLAFWLTITFANGLKAQITGYYTKEESGPVFHEFVSEPSSPDRTSSNFMGMESRGSFEEEERQRDEHIRKAHEIIRDNNDRDDAEQYERRKSESTSSKHVKKKHKNKERKHKHEEQKGSTWEQDWKKFWEELIAHPVFKDVIEKALRPYKSEERAREAEEARVKVEEEQARRDAAEKERECKETEELNRQREVEAESQRLAEEARLKAEQEQICEYEAELPILDIAVNTDRLAEGLRNLETMFNGQMAPDMDMFDDMLSAFFDEKTFKGEGQSMAEFDPSIVGDYAISSCQYRDEKLGVAMDIGRVMRFVDGELYFDAERIDVMTLSGINVMPETGEITFALNGVGERVMIKSDLASLETYVAQKTIEGMVYIRSTSENIPNIDLDKLVIWGVDKQDIGKIRSIASVVADFLPYVGTTKAICELMTGRDYIGGGDISRIVAACGVIGSIVPVPGAGKAGKFIGKAIQSIGKYGIQFVGRVEKELIGELVAEKILINVAQGNNFERFIKKLPVNVAETAIRELPDGGKAFQATVAGRVPGSKAVYEKQVDLMGKTIQYTKTTYDPVGQIVHVKDKITGNAL